jgi:hypothetical protein
MGGGWWVALALSLIMIFALRSGTVGAPAQASVRSLDSTQRPSELFGPRSPEKLALERDLRAAARELTQTRSALDAEKARTSLLQESYDGLDHQFTHVTELVRSQGAENFTPAAVEAPLPVETIIVLQSAPSKGANESQ